MVAANREFAQQNRWRPNGRCARSCKPRTSARVSQSELRVYGGQGLYTNYDFALDVIKHIPYNKWREYDRRIRCASTPCACVMPG